MDRPPAPTDVDAAARSSERLEALRHTELLDTPPEDGFDRLTALAARVIGVPMALLSLVDAHRAYYKSAAGLREPLTSTRQLDGRTLCHYTVASAAPVLVDDVAAHPVFRDLPAARSLGAGAYAGVPLIVEGGHAVGALCAVALEPRQWSALDVEILTELAQSAVREINLRAAAGEARRSADAALDAVRTREAMLSVVAHDLRNPLHVITMGAYILATAALSEDQAKMLARVEDAAGRMGRLIEDLLEVSILGQGHLVLQAESVGADAVLADAASTVTAVAESAGVQLVANAAPGLPPLSADRERLVRAISSFIGHAVFVSGRGGTVRIAATRRNNGVCFAIAGDSAFAEDVARTSDGFWRAESGEARRAGLRLAIAKAIVEAHGGSLEGSSISAGESELRFTVPAA